jgi:hypothetical protein
MIENPNKLYVKIHIKFKNNRPYLLGLHIEGFGWICGGVKAGDLVINSSIDLGGEVIEYGDNRLLSKLLKIIQKDFHETYPPKTIPKWEENDL